MSGEGVVFRPHGEGGANAQVVQSLFFVYLSSLLKRRRARAAVLLSGSRINPGVHSKSRASFALPFSRGQAAKMPPGALLQGAVLGDHKREGRRAKREDVQCAKEAQGPLVFLHPVRKRHSMGFSSCLAMVMSVFASSPRSVSYTHLLPAWL